MSVLNEINKFADKADKPALRWLFSRYHWASQWDFVADCTFKRYGTRSYEVNRVWRPTEEGRILYRHRMELPPTQDMNHGVKP